MFQCQVICSEKVRLCSFFVPEAARLLVSASVSSLTERPAGEQSHAPSLGEPNHWFLSRRDRKARGPEDCGCGRAQITPSRPKRVADCRPAESAASKVTKVTPRSHKSHGIAVFLNRCPCSSGARHRMMSWPKQQTKSRPEPPPPAHLRESVEHRGNSHQSQVEVSASPRSLRAFAASCEIIL